MGLALGMVSVVLWGLSFVATKLALAEVTPTAVALGRTALATLFLGAVSLMWGVSLRPSLTLALPLAAAGVLGVVVHQLLQVYGLTLTTAVRTGWLIGVIPIWSALIALLFLREKLGWQKVAGLALGLLGVGLLITEGKVVSTELLPQTKGDLLILLSTINWAVYTVLGRHLTSQISALAATTFVMAIGLTLLVPIAGISKTWFQLVNASAVSQSAIIFLGVGCSGIAYLCWYAALERKTASEVASLLYLEPLVTLAAGTVILAEPIVNITVVSGLMVLLGVYLAQRVQQKAGAKPRRTEF